ncbi:MAG TPA: Spo0E family sporulation regulatory protein-aspartic acid phosphatase [Clostridiales bacterium]|nr:Spo0E family sporulation regulatory protein-aspartic acid phosphatase [Clostridiales bacterium]HOL91719.1 Spo0E family sporulation regulatory protein-aspartic acid phosphatase [Clostridiales bacterium]HPP35468.1 Spo0E family sporulation regulatory protein-aspartic acid phosphatase [Clostridiales bacterium]
MYALRNLSYLKRRIDKLRMELEQKIKSAGTDDICMDEKLYRLSAKLDVLINKYIKEQQKIQQSM